MTIVAREDTVVLSVVVAAALSGRIRMMSPIARVSCSLTKSADTPSDPPGLLVDERVAKGVCAGVDVAGLDGSGHSRRYRVRRRWTAGGPTWTHVSGGSADEGESVAVQPVAAAATTSVAVASVAVASSEGVRSRRHWPVLSRQCQSAMAAQRRVIYWTSCPQIMVHRVTPQPKRCSPGAGADPAARGCGSPWCAPPRN